MAYIVTQAQGKASNGKIPILDVIPTGLHDRSPIILGSTDDVNEVLDIIKKHEKKWPGLIVIFWNVNKVFIFI